MDDSSILTGPRKPRPMPKVSLKPDLREQLVNDRKTGQKEKIAISAERIHQLHALMYDIDPSILRPGGLLGKIPHDPHRLYRRKIKPMLDRNELLNLAEVRCSGSGIHVLLWFAEPVQLDSDRRREELSCVYDLLLPLLPSDPHQPRLTAFTRKVGSINPKSNTKVVVLKEGTPVPYEAVRQLASRVAAAPLRMVVGALLGKEEIAPCPVCVAADSHLVVRDHVGMCYSCGQVTIDQIWQLVYRQGKKSPKEVGND